MEAAQDCMDLKLLELLKEVRIGSNAAEFVESTLDTLANAIKSIPSQEADPAAASGFVRDLKLSSGKLSFVFHPPEYVQPAGSHTLRAVTKPDVNADLLIRMPKECFHEKDYLNYRYHAKRCLYLCVIEKSLRSLPYIRKMEWSCFHGESRKPVLKVYPVVELEDLSGFYIRIIPTASFLFSVSKLDIRRNNVRAHKKGEETLPTPKYNSSILEDMFLEENAGFVQKAFSGWDFLSDALVLLKVWARQRSGVYTHDCLNGYIISSFMAFLTVESGKCQIGKSFTARKIFRIMLKFLESQTVWDKGLVLQPLEECSLSKADLAHYLQTFSFLAYDVTGHFNLAYRMTKPALLELQHVAACTLDYLDKAKDGGFEEIFMTKVDFAADYDSCLRLTLKENAKISASDFCLDDELWSIYERNVHSLLQQGLTDRVKAIRVLWKSTPAEWDINDGFSNFGNEPLIVGILFSSLENSFRLVDIGPSPENKEKATEFRKFWGEKAEMRRFEDGTIAESTVWQCESSERHLIIKRMVEHVLTRHLSVKKDDIMHTVDQLDFSLNVGGKDHVSFTGTLLQAFERLSKRLRDLDEIPLRVSTVQPLDPAFRHTSVLPPAPHPLAYEGALCNRRAKRVPSCIQSLDVMIQLEGSGNWPMDDVAIEKTKLAFLLKIGESLQTRYGMFCSASEDDVSVLSSGYSFSLKILHERGSNMLKSQVRNESWKNVSSLDKELFVRSQHSSMINGLHGLYPTYGPVVRLAKRWISSHLFSSFLAEEAIELIVAYLFLKPFPFSPPFSRVTGFLRFLRLLATYDWTYCPMIVDINNELSVADQKEIEDNFMASRKSCKENSRALSAQSMFIATSYDRTSEAWTKHSLSKTVLKRLVAYARSSAELLTNLILHRDTGCYRWECLFQTPLSNYDAIVLLHRGMLSLPQRRLMYPAEAPDNSKLIAWGKPSSEFQAYLSPSDKEDARSKLLINFNPTQCFLQDLHTAVPDTFLVWHDSLGGEVVGLTWDKQNLKKRLREEEAAASDSDTDPSVAALRAAGEVGKGLVKGIYLLKAPRLDK